LTVPDRLVSIARGALRRRVFHQRNIGVAGIGDDNIQPTETFDRCRDCSSACGFVDHVEGDGGRTIWVGIDNIGKRRTIMSSRYDTIATLVSLLTKPRARPVMSQASAMIVSRCWLLR
jgi:hypothetical protein